MKRTEAGWLAFQRSLGTVSSTSALRLQLARVDTDTLYGYLKGMRRGWRLSFIHPCDFNYRGTFITTYCGDDTVIPARVSNDLLRSPGVVHS